MKETYVDPTKVVGKPCPICKKEMTFEHNCFTLDWFCDNPKCSAFLKRHGGVSKTFTGKIMKDW